MAENTEKSVGTSLEVLAPYLPYEIEVEIMHNDGITERGLLTAFVHRNTCARIEYREDGELIQPMAPLRHCLPVLRPFSQLTLPLPDGTVPAHRVLEILEIPLRKGESVHINDWTLWVSLPGLVKGVWTLDRFMAPEIPLDVATYLRSKHFAVGLQPHQYIEAAPAGGGSSAIERGPSRPPENFNS